MYNGKSASIKGDMTKKLTKEEFINRSKEVHGESYDYSRVEYINNSTKVNIYCNKHSLLFLQRPGSHMQGRGCPDCRYEKTSVSNTKTQKSFVEDSIKVHGQKYSYSEVEYINTFTPVKIICNKHQSVFEQKPVNHLAGKGCLVCAKEKVFEHIQSLVSNKEEFEAKAKLVHSIGLYDYSETIYKRASEKVSIFCNRHQGYFKISPNSHLRGVGCASCAVTGYSRELEGKLYILSCGDITKVGITNFLPTDRAKTVSKSFGDDFKVVWQTTGDGGFIDDLETKVLRRMRKSYARPSKRFQGHSECFIDVRLDTLLEIISQESV